MFRGLRPRLQRLDNEASQAFVHYIQDEMFDFQLAPHSINRRHATERAIRIFKNRFIAIMCGTDPNFNLALWEKLIPQALITLNLLRKSNLNSSLSAYSQFNGTYDFNRTPIAPLGMRVMVHENQTTEKHGHLMQSRVGTSGQLCTTTDATRHGSRQQGLRGFLTPSPGSHLP